MSDRRFEKLKKVPPIRVAYGVLLTIARRLPMIAIFTVAIYAIFFVGQQVYYRVAPGESFLNYYYAKVDDTPIGTDPLMTLCRRVNYEGIKIDAFRTFIYYDQNGASSQVAEYSFEANVEKDDGNCTNIRLQKQPQKAGTYRAHTEYVFYVNGIRKSGKYDTNQYKMTETNVSLQSQIQVLQRQIDILKAQLEAQGEDVPEAPRTNTQSSTNTNTDSKQQQTASNGQSGGNSGGGTGSSNGNNGNTGGNTPPPPPADTNPLTRIVNGTVDGAQDLLNGILGAGN